MDSNIYKFVLERVNVPDTTVILDKPEHTYTCGRAKDNQIVCLSLTVSRRHCIFFLSRNELYVTDLKSSNGLFINGIEQKPFQTIKLHENDVIGIGCPDVHVNDNAMFAYKLRILTLEPRGNRHNTSAFSETTLNLVNTSAQSTPNSESVVIVKRKREQRNNDVKIIPNKIPKLDSEQYLLEQQLVEAKPEVTDENDLEIVHVSINNSTTDKNSSNCDNIAKATEINNRLNTNEHVDTNNFETSYSESSAKQLDPSMNHKTKSEQSLNFENGQSFILSNNGSTKDKENYILPSSNNTEGLKKNMSQVTEKRIGKTILHDNGSTGKVKTNMKDINKTGENSSKVETPNTTYNTNQFIAENNRVKNVLQLPSNFIQNGDTIIKLEEELQLTDIEENMVWNCENGNSASLISPLKLKKIQQEPKTKFSVDDVVNLSDSEDDIFPCSQLFDIGFGMNTSVKQEVKEESTETDNNRFSRLDDAELVISLTDSEDEDNNWLHRLSRSQILNENDEIDLKNENDNIKEDDMEMEVIDIEDTVYTSDKTVKQTQSDKKHKAEKTKIKKYAYEKEDTLLPIVKNANEMYSTDSCAPEKMEIEAEDVCAKLRNSSSNTTDSNQKHSEFQRNQSSLSKEKEADITGDTSKKRKSLEKKVPQIEPPHLPTRRRSSLNKVQEAVEKSKPKLSAKERKELEEKMKIEEYWRAKDQKNRKVLHKWADCLPPGKKKTGALTKEERKALSDNRKLKLKKLAMKEKEEPLENCQEKKRVVTKPKAKISVKTRGDFLVNEQVISEVADKSKTTSSYSTVSNNNISSNLKTNECVKNKDVSKEITKSLRNSLTLTDISTLGKIPKKNNSANKIKTNVMPQEVLNNAMKEDVLPSKSQIKTLVQKQNKRVSFSVVLKTVHEYEIDESNVLKKLTGKDAPIPIEKSLAIKSSKSATEFNAKLNEFLLRIFSWSPVWLEEQQHLNTTPPVVKDNELNLMLTHYKSYNEYYNIISPLLLLETWYGITKEFQVIEQDFRRPTLMCSIVENSIQTNTYPTNVLLSTLMIEVLVTKEDMRKQAHPVYGDLVFFEYIKNHEKGQTFHKLFAYVTNMHQTILTPFTHYNKDLKHYVKFPYALLTYTMTTKPLDKNIAVNRVQRLRTVTYLRPNLRLVQALQYLPNSPLMKLILNPKIDMYHLPVAPESDALITKDSLNQKQLEAVHKVTKAIVQKDAKLCFIQGPPGTGKSKVIVNIVAQVLYGGNRYTSNGGPLRMLVCAPSNAAVDEIVLRLLHLRSTIKQNRFRMVRIGRSEMMHPMVRDISVTELAKRDVKRTTANSNNIPSDSVEEEKLFLESKMNALKCEIANSHNIDEVYKKHIKMKLADMAAKYELLKNRRPLNEINPKELARLQRAAENRILAHADIITCTLSSCYTNQMESIFGGSRNRISVCIVDEATQSCEAETLIPLMLGVNMLVLVGDPNQLPATVLSPQAKKLGLDQSIFSRVQNAFDLQLHNPIIMLDTQYRMQNDICHWPNKFFYGAKLKSATERNENFPFHSYRILNLNTNQNTDNFSNTDEAEFVANMILSMLTISDVDKWESNLSFGILTPYNNQKSIITRKINEKITSVPDNVKKKVKIEVNTVDGFQGQERDVIIMSCVRSQKIGFLSDRQRLCVALTRAKHSLILCGNFNIFMRDSMWNSLLSDARSRRVYFHVNANAQPKEIKTHVIKCVTKK